MSWPAGKAALGSSRTEKFSGKTEKPAAIGRPFSSKKSDRRGPEFRLTLTEEALNPVE